MYTVEDKLKADQPEEYEWFERHRSRLTLFFIWLENKLDKLMGVIR